MMDIVSIQVERKIEVSREKYTQLNLLVSIEKWSLQIILRFFELLLDFRDSETADSQSALVASLRKSTE